MGNWRSRVIITCSPFPLSLPLCFQNSFYFASQWHSSGQRKSSYTWLHLHLFSSRVCQLAEKWPCSSTLPAQVHLFDQQQFGHLTGTGWRRRRVFLCHHWQSHNGISFSECILDICMWVWKTADALQYNIQRVLELINNPSSWPPLQIMFVSQSAEAGTFYCHLRLQNLCNRTWALASSYGSLWRGIYTLFCNSEADLWTGADGSLIAK